MFVPLFGLLLTEIVVATVGFVVFTFDSRHRLNLVNGFAFAVGGTVGFFAVLVLYSFYLAYAANSVGNDLSLVFLVSLLIATAFAGRLAVDGVSPFLPANSEKLPIGFTASSEDALSREH